MNPSHPAEQLAEAKGSASCTIDPDRVGTTEGLSSGPMSGPRPSGAALGARRPGIFSKRSDQVNEADAVEESGSVEGVVELPRSRFNAKRRARRFVSAAAAAVALLCVLTSCTGSPTPTQTGPPATTVAPTTAAPTTTAESTAACEDVAELKSSLEALTNVKPREDGVAALRTAIANVRTSLESAEASSSGVLQPSIEQVKTAFAELQTAASGLSTDNLAQKAPSIVVALQQVRTATAELSSTLKEACPRS